MGLGGIEIRPWVSHRKVRWKRDFEIWVEEKEQKKERFYVGFNFVEIGVLNISLMADVAFPNWLA